MQTRKFRAFFEDSHGHVVIWQWPNALLCGWLLFKILSLVISTSSIKAGCAHLSTALLFTWAYLEATKGVSPFRKTFGLLIGALIIIGFFRS